MMGLFYSTVYVVQNRAIIILSSYVRMSPNVCLKFAGGEGNNGLEEYLIRESVDLMMRVASPRENVSRTTECD